MEISDSRQMEKASFSSIFDQVAGDLTQETYNVGSRNWVGSPSRPEWSGRQPGQESHNSTHCKMKGPTLVGASD
jgi:hypothetical protein